MDVILQYLNAAAAYASVAAFTMIVGTMYLLLTYPALWFWTAIIALGWYLTRRYGGGKRLRRLWCWYVWYPIQRSIHRLTVPARRRTVGYLMCKIKKSVLADKLDDCLQQMVADKHLSMHDYRNLCAKIGVAIEVTDLIPKGKRWRDAIALIVKKNIAETRAHINAMPRKIPGAPEPAEPGHQELQYLRRRNVA